MAATTHETPETPETPGRRRSPEARWWLFMRVSGVLLAVLVLVHVVDTSVVHEASSIDAASMERRWANPFWRWWDGALIGLGLVHGAHGVRLVVEDLVDDPARRLLATTVLATVAGGALLLAAITVFGA